ncbi:flagellar biosynthetic protein FliP [Firmicutes bacterium CAG:882]|mgnify:CR=1 FL=1|jgi:flagellar biosynthetic protein FliP|nr:flagellar biosynthetic protein FliP [Firmicutes bacterium CAG:882]
MYTRKNFKKNALRFLMLFTITFLVLFMSTEKPVYASEGTDVLGTLSSENSTEDSKDYNLLTIGVAAGDENMASVLQMLALLTVISLAPSILIMLTSFTRIIIVLHFTRAALNTQTVPPNQVLVGLALFLTFFIMAPTFSSVYQNAVKPLAAGEITSEEAFEVGMAPIREFMFGQITREKDLKMFLEISGTQDVQTQDDIPTSVLIPSFITSELRTAFIIGFVIYIPFIIIDMVVASTLMSMGMMMLPPTTISMPFKILLFIIADGWNLVIGNLVKTFYH